MTWIESTKSIIQASGIEKYFNLSPEEFLFVLLASLIVGFICLTFYYVVFKKNKDWISLGYIEKATTGLVLGLETIITSSFIYLIIWLVIQIISKNVLMTENLLTQLLYILPFGYFYLMFAISKDRKFKKLDFLKWYLVNTVKIMILADLIIIVLVAFFVNQIIIGLVLLIIFIGYGLILKKIEHKK